jgi:hypothetical protein
MYKNSPYQSEECYSSLQRRLVDYPTCARWQRSRHRDVRAVYHWYLEIVDLPLPDQHPIARSQPGHGSILVS